MPQMSPARRSALLAQLLKQQQEMAGFRGNRTGAEALARLGTVLLNKRSIDKLDKEQQGFEKRRGVAEQAALEQLLSGGQPMPQTDFQGNPVTGQGTVLPQQPGPDPTQQAIGLADTDDAVRAMAGIVGMGKQPLADPQVVPGPQKTHDAIAALGKDFPNSPIRGAIVSEQLLAARQTPTKMHQGVKEFLDVTEWNEDEMGTPEFKDAYLDFQKAKKVATTINNNMGKGETGTIRDLGPSDHSLLETRFDEAESAFLTHKVSGEMLGLLDDGVFTGLGADVKIGLARGLELMAGKDYEGGAEAFAKLANTQAFGSKGGVLVGQIIRLFGSGTGLSDADREYAAAIAGAVTSVSEKGLRIILQGGQERSIRKMKQFNGVVDAYSGINLTSVYPKMEIPEMGAIASGYKERVKPEDADENTPVTDVYDVNTEEGFESAVKLLMEMQRKQLSGGR